MSARRWLLLVVLLGACAKKAAPAEDEADEAAAPIATECVAARAGDAHAHVSLRGVVATPPDRSATVAPQVAGRVVGLRVHEGDRVAAGALLATIEDPSLGEAVVESDAGHASARAALANADAALARARRLFEQGIAPRRDVEDAEARRAAALAEAQAAEARGGLARAQRGKARVTAPIAGVVIRVYRRNGELVDGTPATPLVDLADPSRLELRADAPAAQLVRLVEGAAAEVRLDALPGVSFAAKLAYVSPAVDTVTSLGVVRAAIVPAEGAPGAPGAPAPKLGLAGALSVAVPGPAGAVLVPQVALRRAAGGGEEVVVCDVSGKGSAVAHLRAVETAGRSGSDVEITSGLKEGERVATRHVVALEEGAAIEVAATPEPANPQPANPQPARPDTARPDTDEPATPPPPSEATK